MHAPHRSAATLPAPEILKRARRFLAQMRRMGSGFLRASISPNCWVRKCLDRRQAQDNVAPSCARERENGKKSSRVVMSYIILKENDIFSWWTQSGMIGEREREGGEGGDLCNFSWNSDPATGDVQLAMRCDAILTSQINPLFRVFCWSDPPSVQSQFTFNTFSWRAYPVRWMRWGNVSLCHLKARRVWQLRVIYTLNYTPVRCYAWKLELSEQ